MFGVTNNNYVSRADYSYSGANGRAAMTLHLKALRGTLYAFVSVAALALVVTLARFLCRRCAPCRSCADADTEPMLTTHTEGIEAAEPADVEVDMLDSSKPVFKGLSPGYVLSRRARASGAWTLRACTPVMNASPWPSHLSAAESRSLRCPHV